MRVAAAVLVMATCVSLTASQQTAPEEPDAGSPDAADATGPDAAGLEPATSDPPGADPPGAAEEGEAGTDPDAEPEPPPEVLEIGDGLYVLPYCGNATLRITPDGVVLAGDRLTRYRAEIVRLLATVTERRIMYELRTRHAAGDDDGRVAPDARHLAPARGAKAGAAGAAATPADIDFTTRLSLFPGGVEVRMHHLGPGRGGGDAAVLFPDRAAVYAGQLVTADPPLVDYARGGSVGGWIEALNALLALEFDTVILRDGPVLSKGDAQGFRDRLVTLRMRVLQLVRREIARERIADHLQTDDLEWPLDPDGAFSRETLPALYDEVAAGP